MILRRVALYIVDEQDGDRTIEVVNYKLE